MGTTRCYRVAEAVTISRPGPHVVPNAILVHQDGTAVALYDDTPLLRFSTLADLLQRFDLVLADLVDSPREGLSSW